MKLYLVLSLEDNPWSCLHPLLIFYKHRKFYANAGLMAIIASPAYSSEIAADSILLTTSSNVPCAIIRPFSSL